MTTIHTGFLKTASSLLQKRVFPHHPEISYFNPLRHSGHADMHKDPIAVELQRLNYQGNHAYDPELLKNLFRNFTRNAENQVVVSSEGFSSYDGNIGLRAERLHEVFSSDEPTKILVVLRNQFDSMRSFQKQNGAKTHLIPGPLDRVDWVDWLHYQMLPGHRHQGYLSMLDYNNIISYYEKLFGRENITVMLYETLQTRPGEFANQLEISLNLKEGTVEPLIRCKKDNVGPKQAYRRYNWRVPQMFARRKDPQDFGTHENTIRDLFAVGNADLARRYNLPLDSFGYPVD